MIKKTLISLLCALCLFSTNAQNKWQELMFNREANFYDIQTDFYKYYDSIVGTDNKIPKGTGIKQFKRWEYYWQHRIETNGNFPIEGHVYKEFENYQRLKGLEFSSFERYTSGSGEWELVGPTSLPLNGTGQLNGNGRINCITFHPTDANTIFVGAPSGGVWKTTDNGDTWSELSNGLIRLGISSLIIDPNTPDTMYIATGDRDSGDSPGYGVWRTTDGGANWSAHNNGMGNVTINEILMDPNNAQNMLAAAANGYIYRTSDGGASWFRSNFLGVIPKDLSYHPTDVNTVYTSGSKFFKSTDGGANFTEITNGLPTTQNRIAIAVSADEPNWVYALAGNSSGLVGIYRSEDSGDTFSARTTTPNILGYETDGSDARSQSWYDLVLIADPNDADVIYSGGINLWKSINGGTTMDCVSYWVAPVGGIDAVHADQHALEFSPHNGNLYNGNDGGVYYTTDTGTTWNDISSGLSIAQVYKIGVSQSKEGLIINGYQDNGTGISNDKNFVTEIGGDGMECIINPDDENIMYGSLYYGDIRQSLNGGLSFSNITSSVTEDGAWVTPYKLDPKNSNQMFAGFVNVWKNDDLSLGDNWTQISSLPGTDTMRDLAIAPSNSDVIYLSRNNGQFYISTDANAAVPFWMDITINLPVAAIVVDIEIDPNDPTHIFIALNGKIYESLNSGTNWTDISGTLPNISLNSIVIDHDSAVNAMYVGMDVGVYYKDDNLSDWVLYSDGLANLEITELEIHYDNTNCNSQLYAATYGQGLWKSPLKDPGNTAPIACFKASATKSCVGETIILSDNSSYTPTSWTWTITPNTYTYVDGTTANSENPKVQFNSSDTYTVSLDVTNATGSDSTTKTDHILIESAETVNSLNVDFEAETNCSEATDCDTTICNLSGNWTNLGNGTEDNIDWRVDSGGTISADTGPTVDFSQGDATGKYLYLEASGGCSGQTAVLESTCIDLDDDYNFSFAYHMFGTEMGSLHLDLFSGGSWILDVIPAVSGNQGDEWKIANLDLSAYNGESIKLRIRGITGSWWGSDMAIDAISFSQTLSTDSQTLSSGISVHPNPFESILTVKNSYQTEIEDITVFDLAGRTVQFLKINNIQEEINVDLSTLDTAIYMVNIRLQNGSVVKRVIKR